ncbi:MAG: hypothetical protein IPM97_16805 [Bdellovibrionaceae bacterium]|nr:hypothetical protein [Pseudobdellovibrionaceae bacterium]
MKNVLVILSIFIGHIAFADQCQWTSGADSASALQLINLHKEVMYFCQNCGDNKPSYISEIDSATNTQAEMSGKKFPFRTIKLSKGGSTDEVDLAYLYVRTGSDIFANVAHLVGCPSSGAITFIQTTNTNKKIQHFYDATGERHDTATTTAAVEAIFGGKRKPASKK